MDIHVCESTIFVWLAETTASIHRICSPYSGTRADVCGREHRVLCFHSLLIYIHFVTGMRLCRHVCPLFEKPLLGICRRGGAVHQVLAVLQPFRVWEAQVPVPTSVPTPSLCLSLDPTLLGNLGEGVQVEQARELCATLTHAVGITLPFSESQDVYTNPRALVWDWCLC